MGPVMPHISKGVDVARVQAVARSEMHPVVSKAAEQGRVQNRRVEIEVAGHEKQ